MALTKHDWRPMRDDDPDVVCYACGAQSCTAHTNKTCPGKAVDNDPIADMTLDTAKHVLKHYDSFTKEAVSQAAKILVEQTEHDAEAITTLKFERDTAMSQRDSLMRAEGDMQFDMQLLQLKCDEANELSKKLFDCLKAAPEPVEGRTKCRYCDEPLKGDIDILGNCWWIKRLDAMNTYFMANPTKDKKILDDLNEKLIILVEAGNKEIDAIMAFRESYPPDHELYIAWGNAANHLAHVLDNPAYNNWKPMTNANTT